ncbi:MAG: amino acid ABC transporter ATP-binding protein [Planctomycetota bacterium]
MPDTDDQPLISCQQVDKRFGPVEVLQGLDLDVASGEHLAIIGPSGSGKSTILRLLMTLEKPSGGSITVDGRELWPAVGDAPLSREQRQIQHEIALQIGMVFQHFHLFPHLRVIDNIALAPVQTGMCGREEAEDRAAALLSQVGLDDKAGAWPGQLSGGQKQRVAIARALALEPRIMLFDEATSALDPELVGEVLGVIRHLARDTDMTMLFVTHQMGFAKEVAHRVLFIEGGRVHEEGTPDQLFSEPREQRTQDFLQAVLEAT